MWLAALESGAVLVVDEIESSMHPLLTRHLIEMVQDAAINTNHTQLIFTTHDTGLLDLTLLRRDQIWFAEKDEKTMQTDIYALTQFSPGKVRTSPKGICKAAMGRFRSLEGMQHGQNNRDQPQVCHTRKRNPVVYLICEGSETEIRYFKRFRSRGCNIDIIPISSQYKSADRLVQKAKATMGNNPYTRKMVTPSGAYLTVTITPTRFFCVPNSPLKRKAIIWPILTRLSSCGSCYTL